MNDCSMDALQRRRRCEAYALDDSTQQAWMRRKRRASEGTSSGRELAAAKNLNVVASFCGDDMKSAKLFGVLFPSRSYRLNENNFTRIDQTHWVLDMSIFIGESYERVKDICIFLINEYSIPTEKALALYVQSPGSHYQYCGAVSPACPSAVLSLLWPTVGGQRQLTLSNTPPLSAKIGLAVEDVGTLPALNLGKQRQLEALALKVGENLVNFMQSFSCSGQNVLAPVDILDKWFKKFQEKLRRDSDYMKNLLV